MYLQKQSIEVAGTAIRLYASSSQSVFCGSQGTATTSQVISGYISVIFTLKSLLFLN
jgi:hypothetical protein